MVSFQKVLPVGTLEEYYCSSSVAEDDGGSCESIAAASDFRNSSRPPAPQKQQHTRIHHIVCQTSDPPVHHLQSSPHVHHKIEQFLSILLMKKSGFRRMTPARAPSRNLSSMILLPTLVGSVLFAAGFIMSPAAAFWFPGASHPQRHPLRQSWLASQPQGGGQLLRQNSRPEVKYNVSLLIIDHYDSFTYNLYDYFSQLVTKPPTVITKDAFEEYDLEDWRHIDGIILSPGPGTPQEQPPLSHQAISKNPDLPILGVCLGHQLMALNYGAKVDRAPVPIHGQDHVIKQELDAAASPIFHGLPESFRVVRYHSLAAFDLPEELQVTARSADNVIQAMQHQAHPHFGVQFHPESIGTQHGMAIVDNFCKVVQRHKTTKENKRAHLGLEQIIQPTTLLTSELVQDPEISDLQTVQELKDSMAEPRFRVIAHPFQASAGPEDVFGALYSHLDHSIWLDSSSASTQRGTVDIMAAPSSPSDLFEYQYDEKKDLNDPDILTQLENELYYYQDGKGKGSQHTRRATTTEVGLVFDLSNLEIHLESDCIHNGTLPFDYRGGFLGYLGYELRHDCEQYLHAGAKHEHLHESRRLGPEAKSETPTAAFFLARNSLVYHHPSQTWFTISLLEQNQKVETAISWAQEVTKDICSLKLSPAKQLLNHSFHDSGHALQFKPSRSRDTYLKNIAQCHEFINRGESYELCLTNYLEARLSKARSPWELYKILRRRNPAPYSAFLTWRRKSNDDLHICCSSPERFMSVKRKQVHPEKPMVLEAEAKPIKGTEARVLPKDGVCRNEAERREDERRACSLELSLKNRAENLMIVDLLRNDMSRVCQVGSVHVAKLMAIESFQTVHQMVSTIRGTLGTVRVNMADRTKMNPTYFDLLRSSFPGGSMTGAPKVRTMELLDCLEGGAERGPYSGSLGYLSVNGCMDLNIIIRSAVVASRGGEQVIRVGAGGAITALSEGQDEYEEMLLKSRAVVESIQSWAGEQARGLAVAHEESGPIDNRQKTRCQP